MARANGPVGEATVGTSTSAASHHFSSLFASQNGLPSSSGARLMSKRAISAGSRASGTMSRHSICAATALSSGYSPASTTPSPLDGSRNSTSRASGRRASSAATAPTARPKSRWCVREPPA